VVCLIGLFFILLHKDVPLPVFSKCSCQSTIDSGAIVAIPVGTPVVYIYNALKK
jgi:hypothetical protein